MRKIIFTILTLAICFLANEAVCSSATLPEEAKKMGLNNLDFDKPIEAYVRFDLNAWDRHASRESDFYKVYPFNAHFWKWFLVANRYCVIERQEKAGGEWWGHATIFFYRLVPTAKMRPLLVERADRFLIAEYRLESIDKVEEFVEGDYDGWRFAFTYYVEPLLPELPRLGPFKGFSVALFNRWKEKWEAPGIHWSLGGHIECKSPSTIVKLYGDWVKENRQKWEREVRVDEERLDVEIVTEEKALSKLRNVPALSKKEVKEHDDREHRRQLGVWADRERARQWDIFMRQVREAHKKKEYQKVIDGCMGVLSIDPQSFVALMYLSASYLTLNKPDKALPYTVRGANRYPHPFWFMHIAEAFAQKDSKEEFLFWFEKALKSDVINLNIIKDGETSPGTFKYKNDLDYILLIQKYFGYSVTIYGKQYRIGGDIFTVGKERSLVFIDEENQIVRDPALATRIARAAWVYENIVKAQGEPGSKIVSAILDTHKRLRRYEATQDILARVFVQTLAAKISGGATLTWSIPAGLTWRVAREQFANLRGLLSLKGRLGLEKALDEYEKMEDLIAGLPSHHIDEQTAVEIKELYESAHSLELSYSALLTSLMPKRGRHLVEKALKSIGDELVRTLPLSDAVLTTREVLELQGKMEDALKTDPAFKEYYEKLNLAKRLTEANEQVIREWAKQAVAFEEKR